MVVCCHYFFGGTKMQKDNSLRIYTVLHRLGIPSSLLGYRYIESALAVIGESSCITGRITTYLYPIVAKMNGSTPTRVERAIRHAVSISMERGDIDFINAVFGYTVSSTRGRLTNSEFITMLAEYLRITA